MISILGMMIPIIAIVMIFGTGMLAIYFNYRKRRDMFALYHQERMAAIEKGIELPPLPEDFFREDGKGGKPARRGGHGTLLFGLILLIAGLTLYIALHHTLKQIARTIQFIAAPRARHKRRQQRPRLQVLLRDGISQRLFP